METRKIALACFIGGALCALVALLCTPAFWWLGMLAGFAGGYVAYEFREVLRAIPRAWEEAREDGSEMFQDSIAWLRKPHPFLLYSAVLVLVTFRYWHLIAMQGAHELAGFNHRREMNSMDITGEHALWFMITYCVAVVTLPVLSVIGARSEKTFFTAEGWGVCGSFRDEGDFLQQGYQELPITYRNTARWLVRGTWTIVCYACARFWLHVAIAIGFVVVCLVWHLPCFVARVLKNLIIEIHSNKRVLCGMDSMLGGTVSYLTLSSHATTVNARLAVIFFGGLIGAALGVLNWEIVSKRILRVPASH